MKFLILAIFLLSTATVQAQMTSGITGKVDTSFSNASAFRQAIKKYPAIQLVNAVKLPTVKEMRNLVYCKIGARKLVMDAFYPKKKSKTKMPAVLIIHGGGWRSGSRQQHTPLAQRLADLGYASFTVEYRLSTEALYPAAVHDLKAAVRYLKANARKFNLDTTKVVALGFSAGGELAAFLGATNQNPAFESDKGIHKASSTVQAVIDLDGTLSFVHPESGEGNDSKSISAATYWFGYPKKDNPALWKQASPLTHVGNHTPPVLFINSSVDRMHAGRDDFRKVLDQFNIYSEVHTFPDAPHTFPLFEPWFEPTLVYIDTFLKKVFPTK